MLGLIYYSDIYATKDINKATHYLLLAARQNHPPSQLFLGFHYYSLGKFKKSYNWINKSSENRNKQAHFALGSLHHFGLGTERNIEKAIHHYKDASSFNDQFAKNNLGIIYKNGFGDEIKARIGSAIEYFEEAIRQKNDYLAMYNLAHIYIYHESFNQNLEKAIDLLFKSSNMLIHSLNLLIIILVKYYDSIELKQKIEKLTDNSDLRSQIYNRIETNHLSKGQYIDKLYDIYRSFDYIYDAVLKPHLTLILQKVKVLNKHPNAKEISNLFYEGFGFDLLAQDY